MSGAAENKRDAKITGRNGVTATLSLQEKELDAVVWLNYAVDCDGQEHSKARTVQIKPKHTSVRAKTTRM